MGLISSFLQDDGMSAVRAAIGSGGYKVETINHVFLPFGQHLEPNENAWREPREKLSRLIDDAKSLGARSIYTMSGGHGSLTWEEAAECFAAAIAPCVAQAKAAGIALMIEDAAPLYADIHLAHSLRDAVTLAEIADVGVCIDFFACWTEAGLRDTIRRAVPRCDLVQVCDYVYGDRSLPARAVPGDGAIPVKRMIDWILDAGYGGAFDLELLGPRIDGEGHVAAVRRAADNLEGILQSLGA
ncbi:MAG: sugar phosphate isomerase/epimerase family protein [Rhizomicrobium sp.]